MQIPKEMLKSTRFETIDDMLRTYYGQYSNYMAKTEYPMLTSTSGFYNAIYGAKLWVEITTSYNAFGALPKKVWDHSGYRLITAAGATSSAAIAESAVLPTTLKPTVLEVPIKPQIEANTYEMSMTEIDLAGKDDVVLWGSVADYEMEEFRNRMDRQLFATATTTIASGIESLDRIVSSYAEEALIDAGDCDPWGYGSTGACDRSGGTTYDSYINHNSGTTRTLALSHVDALFTNCRPYWSSGVNKVLFMGFDTEERMEQLLQPQQRFVEVPVTFGVNGVQTLKGVEGGFDVASYKGVPLIPDQNCLADTLSRIILIDMDRCWLEFLRPPQHIESDDYIAQNYFMRKALDFCELNTIATGFHCHGKARDLK